MRNGSIAGWALALLSLTLSAACAPRLAPEGPGPGPAQIDVGANGEEVALLTDDGYRLKMRSWLPAGEPLAVVPRRIGDDAITTLRDDGRRPLRGCDDGDAPTTLPRTGDGDAADDGDGDGAADELASSPCDVDERRNAVADGACADHPLDAWRP